MIKRKIPKGTHLIINILILAFAAAHILTGQTTEPYRWKNVQIRGGGFVTGVVYSDTEEGLLYARTDVGGAYRWDSADSTWIPVTDHIGKNESDYTGILSIATDPSDPDRVYLAAGLLNITLLIFSATISNQAIATVTAISVKTCSADFTL